MQIISKIISTILGGKITAFSQKVSFRGANLIMNFKIRDFDPKIVEKIFEILSILTAAKTVPVTFQIPLLAPIIAHLQRHPSLHLPISHIFDVFSKYFKVLDNFS